MKFDFSERQKTLLVSALLAILIAIASLAGYELKATLAPAPTPEPDFGVEALAPTKFQNIRVDGTSWLRGVTTFGSSADMGANIISNIGNSGTDFDANGGLTLAGGQTNSNWVNVSAPTAIASATPAARINNLGAGNDALTIEKASTPVLKVGNSGALTGKVLQYNAASGQAQVCGTTNITSTTTIAHGLATPSYVNVTMAQDSTGDGARVTYTNSAAVVTLKGWNSALTPAPNTTPIAVSWCVIGTP